ncbi:hypothetical protein [Rufibacter roseus]|uniref:Anthranilate phosphoribosyltransferase n=1 Tax=Rufibacter roseus TaxID=1567108 RepID=A0ABW2DP02_9BACT|nr:hypothetical protein [Rufibacter roseus]
MIVKPHTTLHNPLVEGIKVVGIGKHGSKPLSTALINEITQYLQEAETIAIQKGAFFGSLLAKGVTPEEQQLLLALCPSAQKNVEQLYDALCPDAPAEMQPIGLRLLQKETLSQAEAKQLGLFLFSDNTGESFRGMAASMLRIRYETEEEYAGLLEAANACFRSVFQKTPPKRQNHLIQLAEPFDGVEHSYMITPLLAQAFQQQGFQTVVSLGRSSGPKLSLNSLDIYEGLGKPFLQGNLDLEQTSSEYGWALHQADVAPTLDQWVERRRLIFKRPFLATLEKVLNPCQANILITSVFHLTYIDKMITLSGMAGFEGVIVLKRGLEGTLAPSIAKASGIVCAARQPDGSFLKRSFEANQEELLPFRAEADDIVDDLKTDENLRLTIQYSQYGSTGNIDFDKRVQLALRLYQQGLDWLTSHLAPSATLS